jgi:hypothetical protein
MIEVWERLDFESVGAAEIKAIEKAVRGRFGDAAVESPMRIARILADEGAVLRHAEIMELWVKRFSDVPYEAEFRNLAKFDDLETAARSIKHIENLRRKFIATGDKEGLRLLREEVIQAKANAAKSASDRKLGAAERTMNDEIAQWITIWLGSPDVFEHWIKMRRNSEDYKAKFIES